MGLACPVELDTQLLRDEISKIYARVATHPEGAFHFHRGPAYAAEFLGYDEAELTQLPPEATASFAGIGNPHLIAPIVAGEVVLDIGCGAGTDLLLAARRIGPQGRAFGVEMTEVMAKRARSAACVAGLPQVEVLKGDATALPLPDASVDVVISNGVMNLVPEKEKAFSEIVRVLRPGGRLQFADITVDAELGDEVRRNIDLWTG